MNAKFLKDPLKNFLFVVSSAYFITILIMMIFFFINLSKDSSVLKFFGFFALLTVVYVALVYPFSKIAVPIIYKKQSIVLCWLKSLLFGLLGSYLFVAVAAMLIALVTGQQQAINFSVFVNPYTIIAMAYTLPALLVVPLVVAYQAQHKADIA